MSTRTRYSFFDEIQNILNTLDNNERSRQDEVTRAEQRGYLMSQGKKKRLAEDKLRDIHTARAGLERLRKEYKTFLEDESRPFGITDITLADGKTAKVAVGMTQRDMDFIRSLDYIPLTKSDFLFYADVFKKDGNDILCRALARQAEKQGYKMSGLFADPEREMQKYDSLLKLAEIVLDADHREPESVAEARAAIKTMIEDSFPYNPDMTPKHTEITIEETGGVDGFIAGFEGLGAPTKTTLSNNPDTEPSLDEQMRFVDGLEEGSATELLRSRAEAEIQHSKYMAQTSAPTPEGGNDAGH